MILASLSDVRPGDAVVVDSRGFLPFLIKVGEYIRWKKYRRFSHAAIVTEVNGPNAEDIICVEMEWPVGNRCALAELQAAKECVILQAPAEVDRSRAVAYANTQVGTKYALLTIFSISFNLFTPKAFRLDFRRDDTLICSALVAYAWVHGGWISPLGDPFQTTPAELAEWGS